MKWLLQTLLCLRPWLRLVWFTLFLRHWLVDMNLEQMRKEAEEILGGKDSMRIQEYLTKKELKRIQRKVRKILWK